MTRREAITTGAGTVLIMATGANGGKAGAASGEWSKQWRIVDAATGKTLRPRDLTPCLSRADAVFVGEQHDDPETHRVELALLRLMHGASGARLTLALEMLERDVQAIVTEYVSGKTDEAAFLKASRPWPNYQTDYHPLIEFARAHNVPVLASNAPAPLVKQVGREGLIALEKASPADRAQAARFILCPDGDEYARRFRDVMNEGGGHGDSPKMEPAMVERFYAAQCVRDDTMAETVAGAMANGRQVLHINGAFHSDAGLGTVARLRFRRPLGANVQTVKVIALANREEPKLDTLRGEANLLVFVPGTEAKP